MRRLNLPERCPTRVSGVARTTRARAAMIWTRESGGGRAGETSAFAVGAILSWRLLRRHRNRRTADGRVIGLPRRESPGSRCLRGRKDDGRSPRYGLSELHRLAVAGESERAQPVVLQAAWTQEPESRSRQCVAWVFVAGASFIKAVRRGSVVPPDADDPANTSYVPPSRLYEFVRSTFYARPQRDERKRDENRAENAEAQLAYLTNVTYRMPSSRGAPEEARGPLDAEQRRSYYRRPRPQAPRPKDKSPDGDGYQQRGQRPACLQPVSRQAPVTSEYR